MNFGGLVKAQANNIANNGKLIELVSIVCGALAVGCTLIFIILKEDGHTGVSGWPWSMVVIPSTSCAFFFLLVWTFVHYQEAGLDLELRWTLDLARYTLAHTDVDAIEQYHERYLFRDLMMAFALCVGAAYAVLIHSADCGAVCPTPFSMFATAVIVINVLRLAAMGLRAYFDYHRLRELAGEIRYFKSWRDERRFRDYVVPAVAPRFSVNPYKVIEAALFVGALVFLAMATMWVQRGDCAASCARGYVLTQHLVVAMFLLESIYLLSVAALAFFRRSLGLERAERLIDWFVADRERRAEMVERGPLLAPKTPAANAG